jgi:hypothetical protein
MKMHLKIALLIVCGVCVGLVCWFGPLDRMTLAQDKDAKSPPLLAPPQIKSCVERVNLVKAQLKPNEDGSQTVVLELENRGDVDVIAISLETSKQGYGKYEVVSSAFSPDKEPQVIIPSGGAKTLDFDNFYEDEPITIGSVLYADGTEEGCAPSLKSVHEVKARRQRIGGASSQ